MTQKRWNFLKQPQNAPTLAEALHIPPVVATILANRNVDNPEDAKQFLAKSKTGIHHPFLLKDAQKAAQRIKQALDTNETVVIYGDYDVDGITSSAIVYKFLKSLGMNVSYYIPNRVDEGYGINILALQKIRKEGASLMITVDCGITAVGEVEFAKTIGLDIIITDHHTCKEEIPRALAVINPKQPECSYPFKDLAGVGVAFKFILATVLELGLNASRYFDEFIDIVAIGTIADVVSLTGENRLFVSQGLKKLQNTDNTGIQALFEVAGITGKPLTAGNISFTIAPRINAAGRVGSATLAVELLVTNSPEKAAEIAVQLDEENRQRQQTEQEILKDALEMIEAMEKPEEKKVFVLAKEDWHHGVIGIVASRITDKFYKPTILISLTDKMGKGSGRSVKGFNIFDALSYCSENLLKFGGHELAAGLGLSADSIEAFDMQINAYANEVMTEEMLTPYINIDATLQLSDLTLPNAELLSMLEPFGMGNPQPVFAVMNTTLHSVRQIGNGKHCKLTVTKSGRQAEFVGFNMAEVAESFKIGANLDLAFTVDTNVYRGTKQLQLILRDVRQAVK